MKAHFGIQNSIWIRIVLILISSPLLLSTQAFAESSRPADLDCADFGSRELANRELTDTLEKYGSDIHRLDGDRDGEACESLPSAQTWSFVAAGIGALAAVSSFRKQGSSRGSIGVAIIATLLGSASAWILLTFIPRQTPAWLLAGLVGLAVFFALQTSDTTTKTASKATTEFLTHTSEPQLDKRSQPIIRTSRSAPPQRNQCECGAWLFPEEKQGRSGMRCSRIPECGRWYQS